MSTSPHDSSEDAPGEDDPEYTIHTSIMGPSWHSSERQQGFPPSLPTPQMNALNAQRPPPMHDPSLQTNSLYAAPGNGFIHVGNLIPQPTLAPQGMSDPSIGYFSNQGGSTIEQFYTSQNDPPPYDNFVNPQLQQVHPPQNVPQANSHFGNFQFQQGQIPPAPCPQYNVQALQQQPNSLPPTPNSLSGSHMTPGQPAQGGLHALADRASGRTPSEQRQRERNEAEEDYSIYGPNFNRVQMVEVIETRVVTQHRVRYFNRPRSQAIWKNESEVPERLVNYYLAQISSE